MKFTELVYDVIVEEIKNKSTIQYLYKKWLGDNPTDAQKIAVEPYIKFFGEKRDSLSLKHPAVKAFLQKFDGNNGEFFDPKNLKDVTKYTLNQIKDLRSEFVNDEINNNEFIKNTIVKWYGANADEDEKYKAYKIIKWFNSFRPNLSIDNDEVKSFLYRFDGAHADKPYFDPQNLKDLSKYNITQAIGLYQEYHDVSQEMGRNDEEAFQTGGGLSTEAKREASKHLWESDNNVVFQDGPIKVHYIPDQKTAVKYGYYQQEIRNQILGYNWNSGNITSHWCVTGRGSRDSWTNLWGRYRSEGKTFYFVIDESKLPQEGETPNRNDMTKYCLGALQRFPGSRTGWVLTSVLNDNDNPFTWDEILRIYPQLQGQQDTFKAVEYDPNVELNVDTSIIGRINENPGSPMEFAKQDPAIKKAYIDEGHPLKTAKSWETLNSYLRNLYIARTDEGNMFNSYQTTNFIDAIKKTPNFYQLLENKIKAICDRSTNMTIKNRGIGVLYQNIIKHKFEILRTSIDNDNLILAINKEDEDQTKETKCGIYNMSSGEWVTYDGIMYSNDYIEMDVQLYTDIENGHNLIVNVYSKTHQVDHTSIFVVHPVVETNDLGLAHFLSYKRFQELSSKIVPEENKGDGFTPLSNFEKEKDVDIKEMEY